MKKIFAIFSNIFLFIFIFVIELIFSLLFSFKNITSEESIYNIVSTIDVETILTESGIPMNAVYERTESLMISKEDTLKIFSSNAFKKYLSGYISKSIDALRNNNDIPDMTVDDLKNLITSAESEDINIKNKELVILAMDSNKVELEKYLNYIENAVNRNLTGKTKETISFILGPEIFIVYGVLIGGLYLITCLIRWSIYKPLFNFGLVLSVSSVLIIFFSSYINSNILLSYKSSITLLQSNILAFASFNLFIGMILLNLYMLVNKLRN